MRSTETKAAKLRTILHILDWNEDLQALENGPVTAQAIRDFDSEYDWGSVSYGDAVIAWVEADEQYYADADDMDAAFNRILANRNLRRTHELFLAEGVVSEGVSS